MVNQKMQYDNKQPQQITKVLRDVIIASVSPIYWYTADGNNLKNGTIFFVHTGKRIIGITVNHVYKEYVDAINKTNNTITCQIGVNNYFTFEPENRLIDKSEEFDIATFDITEKDLAQMNKEPLRCNQTAWPPSSPKKGQGVFAIGFPGEQRIIDYVKSEIEFGYIHLLLVIHKTTNDHISLQLNPESLDPSSTMPRHYNMGGISGAPLLILEANSIITWQLGGIIYEANKGYELVFARPINLIKNDGTILQKINILLDMNDK